MTRSSARRSDVETFVALKAHVDNWRWQGVPFYLRTGKRLASRQSEISIQFKPVPHSMFTGRGGVLQPNTLVIRLQPEEYIRLLVMAKEPGLDRDGVRLREVPLDLSLDTEFAGTRRRIAYERLLLDLIEGDPTLFVRRDEVEAQWQLDRRDPRWLGSGGRSGPRATPRGQLGSDRPRSGWPSATAFPGTTDRHRSACRHPFPLARNSWSKHDRDRMVGI